MSKHQDEDSDSVQSAVCHAVCCAGSGDPGKTVIVGSLLCVMLYAVLAEETQVRQYWWAVCCV